MRAAHKAVGVTEGPLERLVDQHRHSRDPEGDIGARTLAHAVDRATIGDLRRTEMLVLQLMSKLARTPDGPTVSPRWMSIWQDITARIEAYQPAQVGRAHVSSISHQDRSQVADVFGNLSSLRRSRAPSASREKAHTVAP